MSVEQAVKLASDHTRDVADHYPTPKGLIRAAYCLLPLGPKPFSILDPGAGEGPWGEVAREFWPQADITGVEIREDAPHPLGYDRWFQGTFIEMPTPKPPKGPFKSAKQEASAWARYEWRVWASEQPRYIPDRKFSLIVGNPPYGDAEGFIREGMNHLAPGGRLVYLLRLAFVAGQDRAKGLWREFPAHTIAACARRPSFTGNGKTDATEYAVYYFIKGYSGPTFLERIEWEND